MFDLAILIMVLSLVLLCEGVVGVICEKFPGDLLFEVWEMFWFGFKDDFSVSFDVQGL